MPMGMVVISTADAARSAPSAHARILVVEDDRRVAAFLDRALTYEGYDVEVASDGAVGLDAAARRLPDLVLLDVMLPVMDGLEVARQLRARANVPILMLTARETVADRVEGLDAGADDYLTKPFALEELLARLRALLRRHAAQGPEPVPGPLSFADVTLDASSRTVSRAGRRLELRNKEFELLSYFLRNPRRVLSRRAILEEVWGYDFLGDSNVIEVTVAHLRQKMEAAGEPRLICTVRPIGYALRESVEGQAAS
jgi:two-component system response regulator MprA